MYIPFGRTVMVHQAHGLVLLGFSVQQEHVNAIHNIQHCYVWVSSFHSAVAFNHVEGGNFVNRKYQFDVLMSYELVEKSRWAFGRQAASAIK